MTPVSVAAVVEEVRGRLRRLLHTQAVLLLVALVAGLLLAAWALVGRGGWGQGSAVPLVLDLVALGLLIGGVVWFVRERRNTLDERRISGSMERAAGVPDGLLQGALELRRSLPHGVSGALAGRGESALLEHLGGRSGDLTGELGGRAQRRGRRVLGILAFLTPALVLVLLLTPDRSASAWRGLVSPLETLTGPVLPALVVEPGDIEVQRGSGITVQVAAAFRETVTLRWQAAGDVVRTLELPVVEGRAVHPFPEISAPTTYSVSSPDGAATEDFTITPVDPLFVSDLTVRVQFPAYVDRPPEEFRGDVPPLVLPAGTALAFEGRGSRLLSAAALVRDGEPVRTLQVDGPGFRGTWVPPRSGTYGWRFLDGEGNPAALIPPRSS